jgi:hypothetical protein
VSGSGRSRLSANPESLKQRSFPEFATDRRRFDDDPPRGDAVPPTDDSDTLL